jgi:hypothetical protein
VGKLRLGEFNHLLKVTVLLNRKINIGTLLFLFRPVLLPFFVTFQKMNISREFQLVGIKFLHLGLPLGISRDSLYKPCSCTSSPGS